jgi:hypothetical protein
VRNHAAIGLLTISSLAALAGGCTPRSVTLSLSSARRQRAAIPPGPSTSKRPRSAIACGSGTVAQVFGRSFCAIDEPLTWQAAMSRCADHDGHLARIPTRVDEEGLRAAVGSPVPAASLWIDLRRTSDGWRWGEGGPQLTAAAWHPGEPNDVGGTEDCAEWSTSTGRWNDLHCGSARAVLCELSSSSSEACAAERVNTPAGQYCLFSKARLDHDQARELCSRSGGRLARLDTAAKGDALHRTLGAVLAADRVWVGMTDGQEEGNWRWLGDVPVRHGWLAGEPNDAGGEDCGEWRPGGGGFNDLPCSERLPALCELSL